MKTIIHVNRHHIAMNKRHGTRLPVFTVKTWKENRKANSVRIDGPSRLVYSPDKPHRCGAVAWIETEANVEIGHENV